MHIDALHIGGAVLVGIGAIVVMDIWNLFLQHTLNISSLNFCLVGRWLSHMSSGTFMHTNIAMTAKPNANAGRRQPTYPSVPG